MSGSNRVDDKPAKGKFGNLLRLLVYVKPYWISFAAATLCGVIKMLTPVAIAWLVGKAVNILTDLSAGKITSDAAWMQIKYYFFLGLALALFAPIPVYLRSTLAARAVQEVVNKLRCDLYAHIQKLSHSFFDANRSGSLTSRIIGDIEAIQPFISRAFVQIWMSVGMIVIILGYFLSKNVKLALLSISLIPFQLLVQRKIRWKVKENARTIRDQLARLAGSTQEKLAASTIVKTFTGEEDEIHRFNEDTAVLVDLGINNSKLNAASEALMNMLRSLSQLLIIIAGGYMAIFYVGDVSPGLLIQFIMMQGQLYTPFEWLNEMQLIIANAMGATDRVFGIFDTEPDIADSPDAIEAPLFTGNISFRNVGFSYPGTNQPIFTDLSLEIPACTTLALVGPSGGGKTTITNLINRFYEWDKGSIIIDGVDIRNYTLFSLRNQIGLVPQEPILFSGSIEQNILYGNPSATQDEVREAARRAYADEFIDTMDDGYNTVIGERGVRLSGGQKQRISIARAFLKNPAIIILDEATSSLDSESERIVQQALDELMRDRTTIIIAHRLSTIRRAHRIAVISDGRVQEYGSHDELIKKDGLYSILYNQQFGTLAALAGVD